MKICLSIVFDSLEVKIIFVVPEEDPFSKNKHFTINKWKSNMKSLVIIILIYIYNYYYLEFIIICHLFH